MTLLVEKISVYMLASSILFWLHLILLSIVSDSFDYTVETRVVVTALASIALNILGLVEIGKFGKAIVVHVLLSS